METPAIVTEHLTKNFGRLRAVSDLNLHVETGEIYGFLGPNGAGKTTTISLILGMHRPTRGRVRVLGREWSSHYFELKQRMGAVPEYTRLYDDMTALDYLTFFGELHGVDHSRRRASALLEQAGLLPGGNTALRGFSQGMRRKVSIARALLHEPELLIMDEPVMGLDPRGVKEVRDIVLEENRKGTTVFLSSHILSEVERTCRRVGIINRGRLVAEETVAGLRRMISSSTEIEIQVDHVSPGLVEALSGLPAVRSLVVRDSSIVVSAWRGEDPRPDVSRTIVASGAAILGMREREATLEEAFLTITEQDVAQWDPDQS